VILTLMNGTDEQRELVQEAVTRWWGPLMQFHGNPIPPRTTDVRLAIKSQGNEEARQQFLDGYVPQIWELGLTVPDPKLRKNDDGVWEYSEPDWDELKHVVTGHGPKTQERSSCAGACSSRRRGCARSCSLKLRDLRGLPPEKKGARLRTRARSRLRRTVRRVFAHEQYGRRQESVALWVVPREAMHEVTTSRRAREDVHRVDGYSLKAKLKEARERAGTATY
jgi:hypothetical protein